MALDPVRGPTRRRRGARDNEAGEHTRERILDAAERLFAEQGLDAVSVRDITEAARVNTAAIHYHFGSKVELISAIFNRRAAEHGIRREELLAELERVEDLELRDVVETLVRPTAALAQGREGGRRYVAFLAALGGSAELMHLVIDAYDPYTERIIEVLTWVTPDLPADVRLLRFAIGKDLINRVLGQPNGQIHQWVALLSPGADADIVTRLIDVLVGIFAAPVSGLRAAPRRQVVR